MHVTFAGVSKHYGSEFVLAIERLDIPPGERLGVLGNNGAGKTTMLLLMLGILPYSRGEVLLDGMSTRRFHRSWRRRTGSYVGESCLPTFLTPIEYWHFVGHAYGIGDAEMDRRIRLYDGFVELPSETRARPKFIRDYSQGNRCKIGIQAAMMAQPELLILDEPISHLDPLSRSDLESMLRDLNTRFGTTLVVSSHDLIHVHDLSSRVLLLENGTIVHDAPARSDTLRFVQQRLTERRAKRSDESRTP